MILTKQLLVGALCIGLSISVFGFIGGTIVISGDALKTTVSSDESAVQVVSLQVINATTEAIELSFTGCNQTECEYDISSLAAGETYKITAVLSNGQQLHETFQK